MVFSGWLLAFISQHCLKGADSIVVSETSNDLAVGSANGGANNSFHTADYITQTGVPGPNARWVAPDRLARSTRDLLLAAGRGRRARSEKRWARAVSGAARGSPRRAWRLAVSKTE